MRSTTQFLLVAASTLLPILATAQTPPLQATMDSVEAVAFGECWWLGQHAQTKPPDETAFERQCRASLSPLIVQQRLALAETERRMADVYSQLLASIKKDGRISVRSLVLSQRAWVKFRDAHCNLEVERVMGNYGSPHRLAGCLESEAAKRIEYLKGLSF